MPIYNAGKKILDVFKNNNQIRHAYYRGINVFTRRYHLNIFPTPEDATVTIGTYVHQGPTGANIWLGYDIDWSVEKEGYGKLTGTWKATKDEDLYITLKQNSYSYALEMATPARATITWRTKQNGVVIDSETATNVTNFSRAYDSAGLSGTTFEYRIEATGYATLTGEWDPLTDGNVSRKINMIPLKYTVKINPTPSTATVKINNVVRNTYTATHGETVTWSVEATGYASQSGSFVCTSDKTFSVSLQATGGKLWSYSFVTTSGTRYYLYTQPGPTVGGDVYGYGRSGVSLINICTQIPPNIANTGRVGTMVGGNTLYFKVYEVGSNYIQTRPEGTATGHNMNYRAYRTPEYDLYN